MNSFEPQMVIIRENALDYPLGNKLYQIFEEKETSLEVVSSKGPLPLDYDLPFQKQFQRAKKILLVSVRSVNKFQTCKPSAHFQLPLVTGCPGNCHYCYLSTNLGKNPYIKVYVNRKEIFARAQKYIEERKPETTIFEGAATSDPLPVEKWTSSLTEAVKFFARTKNGSFRFVTKFPEIKPFLDINHKKKTEIRFSLNSDKIIKKYESGTPDLQTRLKASQKIYKAQYPLGFLIAPIFKYDNWKTDYKSLIENIKNIFANRGQNITFELISHRYTERAKNIIQKAYHNNKLPMDKKDRKFKYGQFGYGKYIYPDVIMKELKEFFITTINKYLPEAEIKYFI